MDFFITNQLIFCVYVMTRNTWQPNACVLEPEWKEGITLN